MNDYALVALAAFLGGVGAGLLLATTPELILGIRLIRFYLRTRDRKRAVDLWLEEEARRSSRYHL